MSNGSSVKYGNDGNMILRKVNSLPGRKNRPAGLFTFTLVVYP